jgi:hypothetical protein
MQMMASELQDAVRIVGADQDILLRRHDHPVASGERMYLGHKYDFSGLSLGAAGSG